MPKATKNRNLLVTGPPGCGKSTLILHLAGRLPVKARGFTTAEIRTLAGTREGFRITTLSGKEGILAHKKRFKTGPRLGSYRVNLKDLEEIGAAEIEAALEDPAAELIVIDEIARMELFSLRFREAALRALDSPKPLLGTLQIRRDPFLDSVRTRTDTIIFEIARGNLEDMENRILPDLQRMME